MSRRRYKLEPYSGPQSRFRCPKCEKSRCFTRYIDEDGNYLNETVGRCNHESSCGYHYPPREFFQEHYQYSSIPHRRIKTHQKIDNKMGQEQIYTIDMAYVRRSERKDVNSDFTTYLRTIIPHEEVGRLIEEYHLGVTHSGDVIFFEIDKSGRCRTGKIMKYNSVTGHRIKDDTMPSKINWVHTGLKKTAQLPSTWNVTQCLFGEHLLSLHPNKKVALVEAEKTAVICSAFMPEYIWLATGGKSQLNDRVKVLIGRDVTAFPDLDAMDEWTQRAAKYPEVGIKVSHLLLDHTAPSERNSGKDLADWIIEWHTNNSKTKEL